MAVEKWSDQVRIVYLADDPAFSEDMQSLEDQLPPRPDVVVDFSAVRYITSSNIGQLLALRKRVISADGRLVLCNVRNQIWGALLVTGLDKVFEYSADVSTALASLALNLTPKA